ncbi:PTS sugar transporter subunit IIA [Eremococcus coleocola]|uniref:PTS sugar transporter subunit IIA n=1 Tax=Eremococcus coleocola TaxID=88132 RepID=UPI0003F761A2|nr:fructose PTS transporter subunit IIA [Eremococcus coleocola]
MEEIYVSEVVSKDLMLINCDEKNKSDILNKLADLCLEKGVISDKAQFLKDVYLREEEGETGIGQGVAIPHGKSSAVINTRIAVATLENSIDWESLDNEKVNTIFLFAVKNTEANTKHIMLLQQIAILLADDEVINSIKNVTSIDALYDLITNNSRKEG